ncbi:MAG: DUF308 domain-containing protein [Bacteroidales bacterium]|nr:DUF308 domain-containing protein [Bacteroidales bacterium]MCL2739105.1 DUF308 domain-containing protein [Bacteroidales bacterium]
MMIAFYQDYRYGVLRAVIGMLLGFFLIFHPTATMYLLIWILAGLLIAIGAVSVFYAFQEQNTQTYTILFSANGGLSFILGVLMMIFSHFFAGVFIYVLAAVLLLAALGLMIALSQLRRRVLVPLYTFVMPSLLVILSILLIFKPFKTMTGLITIFGVLFAVYALCEATHAIRLFKAGR